MESEIVNNLLYESMDVWRRLSGNRVVRYRCFKIHPQGRFCVQSADSYFSPLSESDRVNSDRQFLELFIESAPEIRSETFPSLDEAIAAHDREFSGQ